MQTHTSITTCAGVYIGSAGLACAGELWREIDGERKWREKESGRNMAGENSGRKWREEKAGGKGGRKWREKMTGENVML